MPIYKLNITIDIDMNDIEGAQSWAKLVLADLDFNRHGNHIVNVSLIREGDRSAANLLSKSEDNSGHYKHHKVLLSEVIKDND